MKTYSIWIDSLVKIQGKDIARVARSGCVAAAMHSGFPSYAYRMGLTLRHHQTLMPQSVWGARRLSHSPAGEQRYTMDPRGLLEHLYELIEQKEVSTATQVLDEFYSNYFSETGACNDARPASFSFASLLRSSPCEARDVVCLSIRLYAAQGQMKAIRSLFSGALRDCSGEGDEATHTAANIVNIHLFNLYLEVLTIRSQYDPAEVIFILEEMRRRSVEANALTYHYLTEIHIRAGWNPVGLWEEMRKRRSVPGSCCFFPGASVPRRWASQPITSQFAAYPTCRTEMNSEAIPPLPATLQSLMLRVLPYPTPVPSGSTGGGKNSLSNSPFSNAPLLRMEMDVVRAALRGAVTTAATSSSSSGSSSTPAPDPSHLLTKKQMVELIERWMAPSSAPGVSQKAKAEPESGSERAKFSQSNAPTVTSSDCATGYPPEYILWVVFELEIRCVLEKANFAQFIQKRHVMRLLLHAAKCGDAVTLTHVLALMDRHLMRRTADTGALAIWGFSHALELESAVDVMLWMEQRGFLESDAAAPFFQRYTTVDTLRYSMDKHFFMYFVDVLVTPSLIERVLRYLKAYCDGTEPKRRKGVGEGEEELDSDTKGTRPRQINLVSPRILDLLVLAYCKIGHEREAMALIQSYEPDWGVTPVTSTLNSILFGLHFSLVGRRSGAGGTLHHRDVFLDLTRRYPNVLPNVLTYKLLIRHAVLNDHIDEAVEYLQLVGGGGGDRDVGRDALPPAVSSVRVEVEMILPILERAARAGDVDTVQVLSQFALDCDIGIDPAVLQNVMGLLTQAGQSVDVIRGHQPLHEALRSRSKVGRQRVRAANIRL